jgi:tetratricopeptide (TPR) repeat protein
MTFLPWFIRRWGISFFLPSLMWVWGSRCSACVRSSRPAAFFAVWLGVRLIPLLNLRVFVANDFAHDRYLYLPSAGLAVLVATLLSQYAPALEKFLDVVNHYPNYWAAACNLALTYYKIGKYPEAEEYFLQAIRINPNKPSEYFYLGMTPFKSGRTAEAITSLRQAIAMRSNAFAYHLALGVMLKTQGDLTGALREFEEELANNPGEPAAVEQVKGIEKQVTSDK